MATSIWADGCPGVALDGSMSLLDSSTSTGLPAVASTGRVTRVRAARLIALGRFVLASSSLLAIWLDPSAPIIQQRLAYLLLTLYTAYSGILVIADWRRVRSHPAIPLVTHAVDLAAFSLFMILTEGPTSPFFLFFVFALLTATLRWQWRGAVATGAIALTVYLSLGFWTSQILQHPAFELDRFVIRSVYLAVLTALVAYLGWHEARAREELARLAAWPPLASQDSTALAEQALRHTARVLPARRHLLVWDESEEPWRYLATLEAGSLTSKRLPPTALEPLVHESVAGRDFLCLRPASDDPILIPANTTGQGLSRGRVIHPDLLPDLRGDTVLSLRLAGESVEGRLFIVDRPAATSDDLVLGRVVARHVAILMDQLALNRRLEESAAASERLRLARELHDGPLQVLAGLSLQLEGVRCMIDSSPAAAQEALADLEEALAIEQRELRSLVEELKPSSYRSSPSVTLVQRLNDVVSRVNRQRNVVVDLSIAPETSQLPTQTAREVLRQVQEALSNAARHSGATIVQVAVSIAEGEVSITVSDDGHGFPFTGRLDHEALGARGLGPRTLMERAAAMGGTLTVDSSPAGSRVEITLPLSEERV